MQVPDFLKSYQQSSPKKTKTGEIRSIEFSGRTYQILVYDPEAGTEGWVFLQLDTNDQVQDCFCSCNDFNELQGCAHAVTAYFKVFEDPAHPLHKKFSLSFWNQICFLFAKKIGFEPEQLMKEEIGIYSHTLLGGRELFFLKSFTKNGEVFLEEIMEDRVEETEETSIKFSNLSPSELIDWQTGSPSIKLQYELSFWSDLAKWCFLEQNRGAEYDISFTYDENKLPHFVRIVFQEIELGFSIDKEDLLVLIPSLSTVSSPLTVFGFREALIDEIEYDEEEGTLFIHGTESQTPSQFDEKKETLQIGMWKYLPEKGFFATAHPKVPVNQLLKGKEITQFIGEFFPSIRALVKGTSVHDSVVEISHRLWFDDLWNLHVEGYVFEPGDIDKPFSRRYGQWLFIESKGFYLFNNPLFDELSFIVPRDKISRFITENRSWLNTKKGFTTHQANIEAELIYRIDQEGHLHFDAHVDPGLSQMEFGQWVYVKNSGFYQKASGFSTLFLRPDTTVNPNAVSTFIKENKQELKFIPNFFSKTPPIKETRLSISLNEEKQVEVALQYDFQKGYRPEALRFFDDYVYVEGEGFSHIPIDPGIPDAYKEEVIISKEEEKEAFISYQLPRLKQYASYIDKKLLAPDEFRLEVVDLKEKGREFELCLEYHSEFGRVNAVDLLKGVLRKKHFLATDAGLISLDEDRLKWLYSIHEKAIVGNCLILSNLDLFRIQAFEKMAPSKKLTVRELLKQMMEFKTPTPPNLSGYHSDLRPYQKLGLEWLWFLYHQGLSGLLCDDMGLGKTHQAMGLISAVGNQEHIKEKKHYLVVCPTSVIYHWQDKLHNYLPDKKIFTFYGSDRNIADFGVDYDILLTSYGIYRREKEILGQIPFEVAIFDELQMAKNPKSQLHQSLKKVDAKTRIGLTGTPIENNLKELKALFDLVLPTYMPGQQEFRQFFITPIERENNPERRLLLTRFIAPFVLRRKKEDVLTDLPDKIEEIAYCPLLPEQHKLYDEVLRQSREAIVKQMGHTGEPIPYLHVFALLSRLKQICDHPAVYLRDAVDYTNYRSGKWERFIELIDEANDSEQKVVVYSQYLLQLDIIEDYLRNKGILFAGIRGTTTNRGQEIERFQKDPECRVFVASLQAAGLGIDLTAASVVIHYDRWWNAARENQATDRVHRIGQHRGVQVFKLVTRGTFEEKIHEMIERKKSLLENVVGVDDQKVLKQFDRSEIMELLQDVEQTSEDQPDYFSDI